MLVIEAGFDLIWRQRTSPSSWYRFRCLLVRGMGVRLSRSGGRGPRTGKFPETLEQSVIFLSGKLFRSGGVVCWLEGELSGDEDCWSWSWSWVGTRSYQSLYRNRQTTTIARFFHLYNITSLLD